MKRKYPALGMGRELDNSIRTLNPSKSQAKTKSPQSPIGKNRQMILEQIADRWSGRGYYPTPSRTMLALLEGVV